MSRHLTALQLPPSAPFARRRLLMGLPLLLALPYLRSARGADLPAEDLAPLYEKVVADPSRSDADHKMDAARKPVKFLEFTRVKPGMRVLDIAAGAGYTSELLARVVGPTGRVFAQVDKSSPALEKRLAGINDANATVVVTSDADPVPASARPLDLITFVLAYHDVTYMSVDRAAMNTYLFDALVPGGYLVIIDHSAKAGTGTADGKTLHRVDESLVKTEVLAAGFVLDQESDFLRNPNDPRDAPFFKTDIVTDRFALRFKKPSA